MVDTSETTSGISTVSPDYYIKLKTDKIIENLESVKHAMAEIKEELYLASAGRVVGSLEDNLNELDDCSKVFENEALKKRIELSETSLKELRMLSPMWKEVSELIEGLGI